MVLTWYNRCLSKNCSARIGWGTPRTANRVAERAQSQDMQAIDVLVLALVLALVFVVLGVHAIAAHALVLVLEPVVGGIAQPCRPPIPALGIFRP